MTVRLKFDDFISDKSEKFYVKDLSLSQNEYIATHSHSFYEFFVVLKGEFCEVFNNKKIILKKRQGQIVSINDIHSLHVTNKYKVNVLRNIAICKDTFENILKECVLKNQTCEIVSNKIIYDLDEAMFTVYKQKTERVLSQNNIIYKNILLKSVLYDLLLYFYIPAEVQVIPIWLKKIYIDMEEPQNYIEGLSKMIELCSKSQGYLNRSFQKYYKISPTEYINLLRIQSAANLLITTNIQIVEICFEVGFNNVSHFNKLFKKRYYTTPTQYRNNKKIMSI